MKIVIFVLTLLFFVGIFTGGLENFKQKRVVRKAEKARIEAMEQIAKDHRQAEQRRINIEKEKIRNYEKVLNFTLRPGEARKIITNGDTFELSYFGKAIIVYHRGAADQWLSTKGSEHFYVYPKEVAPLDAITLIRPKDSIGPLGFNVVLKFNPYNKRARIIGES